MWVADNSDFSIWSMAMCYVNGVTQTASDCAFRSSNIRPVWVCIVGACDNDYVFGPVSYTHLTLPTIYSV